VLDYKDVSFSFNDRRRRRRRRRLLLLLLLALAGSAFFGFHCLRPGQPFPPSRTCCWPGNWTRPGGDCGIRLPRCCSGGISASCRR